jgi:hypothetical protein
MITIAPKIIGLQIPSAYDGTSILSPNTAIHKRCIQSAKTNKANVIRVDTAINEAGALGPYTYSQKEIHQFIAAECAKAGLGVVIQTNTSINNKKSWRMHYADFHKMEFTTELDAQLSKNWDEYTNPRKKIDNAFWEPMIWLRNQIINTFATAYAEQGLSWQQYGMVEDENESAWVIEKEVFDNPGYAPYGTFSSSFIEMMNNRWMGIEQVNTQGALLLRPSYEYQYSDGIKQEISSLKAPFLKSSVFINVHIYTSDYQEGTTRDQFGNLLYQKFLDFVSIHDAISPEDTDCPIVVTECGMKNIPRNLRPDWLMYGCRRLISHPRCRMAIAFTTAAANDDDSMALLDWNVVKNMSSTPIVK